MIHTIIYMTSVISYIYLNNINITSLSMCSVFIKFICRNKSLKDSDLASDPANLTVPFEQVKQLGEDAEKIIDDALKPESKVQKMVSWWDSKKED